MLFMKTTKVGELEHRELEGESGGFWGQSMLWFLTLLGREAHLWKSITLHFWYVTFIYVYGTSTKQYKDEPEKDFLGFFF